MNKEQLARDIAAHHGISREEAHTSIDQVLDGIMRNLLSGKHQRITVTGFGAFDAPTATARMGRNPLTGESIFVPEKKTLRFRPGARFLAFLRRERPVIDGERLVGKDPKTPKVREDAPS